MKTMSRSVWGTVAVLCCLFLWTVSAAEKPHFDSYPNDGPIVIDGDQHDWSGTLKPFGDEPLSIQVANDRDYLYVRLAASELGARMQMTRMGLTIWFDPKGGTKKVLGVKYPVFERAVDGEERGGRRGGYGGGFGRRGGNRGGGDEPNEPNEPGGQRPDENISFPDRIDILGPAKNDAHSYTLDHAPGIQVALKVDEGEALYELRVPLAKTDDHPYAIGVQPGATIGIGLETARPERQQYGGRRGGGFGGGGFGGGFGGRGGGMGGRGGGLGREGGERAGFQSPKPLKGWATVALH